MTGSRRMSLLEKFAFGTALVSAVALLVAGVATWNMAASLASAGIAFVAAGWYSRHLRETGPVAASPNPHHDRRDD